MRSTFPSFPIDLLVFDRNANGDVAPKRVLAGDGAIDISGQTGVSVDPVHNLLLINGRSAMFIFDRTASGDDKPKAVIRGPKSDMDNVHEFQVTPKGWIIAGGGNFAAGTDLSAPGAFRITATLLRTGKFRFNNSRDMRPFRLFSIRLTRR